MNEPEEKPNDRRKYPIQIDETTYQVENSVLTGRSILDLAEKDVETHFVTQVIVGEDDIVINLEDEVDVSQPGNERFTIVAKLPKQCNIIANTRKYEWNAPTISFEELVKIALPDSGQDDPTTTRYTVKYRGGDPSKPEGSLVTGAKVKVKCGMVFDVDRTNRS